MKSQLKSKVRNCQICGNIISVKQGKGRIGLYCENCRKELRNGGFYAIRVRYSGKKYDVSLERLVKIKEKYKSGVTQEILNEWLCSK